MQRQRGSAKIIWRGATKIHEFLPQRFGASLTASCAKSGSCFNDRAHIPAPRTSHGPGKPTTSKDDRLQRECGGAKIVWSGATKIYELVPQWIRPRLTASCSNYGACSYHHDGANNSALDNNSTALNDRAQHAN